mmetsp:Transcript_19783/g.35939  ORF Transcript_19783/g.35939 Transcript_19783/m.35939 type:complete len:113 (+) Transcript_19783:143-481(+)
MNARKSVPTNAAKIEIAAVAGNVPRTMNAQKSAPMNAATITIAQTSQLARTMNARKSVNYVYVLHPTLAMTIACVFALTSVATILTVIPMECWVIVVRTILATMSNLMVVMI